MPAPRKVRPPLTKRRIDGAKPAVNDHFLWDGAEHGLGVKITPAGSKIFILQKSVQGRLKRITIGHHGDITLETARKLARRLNGEIAQGRDPVADARAAREEKERRERCEKTVSDLWDRYWLEVVSTENRPRTSVEKRYMWFSRIEPRIGALKIGHVTGEDVGAVVREAMRIDKNGEIVGGRGAAGNVYRLMHHMFVKALAWGMRPRELGNPLETVTEPKLPRRERLLTNGEVEAILKAVEKAAADKSEHEATLAVIKAAILTGARISELLGLQWKEVRQDELELHLSNTKTGFSRRPISEEAMGVINSVGRLPGCPFVFRSPRDPQRAIEYTTVRKAFERIADRAGVPNCTLHTIRHWFSTMTANSVSNPRIGMALTGHKSHAAYLNYVHADRDRARALAEQLGAFVRSMKAADNVVALKKTKKG
jgi:site-specific recombinase XerC